MPMLSFLAAALEEARLEAGVTLDEVAYRAQRLVDDRGETLANAKGEEKRILIDKSQLSKLERGQAGWTPKIDAIIRGYADACDTTDVAIWDAALRAYGAAESDRAVQAATRKARERSRRS